MSSLNVGRNKEQDVMMKVAIVTQEIRYRNKVIPIGTEIRVDIQRLIALWQDDHVDIFPSEFKVIYLH